MSEEIRDGPVRNAGPEKPKIGAGALAAMGRQGLNELRAAVMPDSNIAQPTETGAIGTATPGEIADARENEPQTEGLVGAAVGAGAVAGMSLVDRIKEMYGRENAATPEKSREPQKSRERGMERE